MNASLQAAYDAAVIEYGQEIADRAAEESIAAYSVNAIAGMDQAACEAEQLAEFARALEE